MSTFTTTGKTRDLKLEKILSTTNQTNHRLQKTVVHTVFGVNGISRCSILAGGYRHIYYFGCEK